MTPTRPNLKPILVISLLLAAVGLYLMMSQLGILDYWGLSRRGADQVDQLNMKIVPMLDQALQDIIAEHNPKSCPGCGPDTEKLIENFFKSLETLESYSRYGLQSYMNRNAIEIKISFHSQKTIEGVPTGISWNGRPSQGPSLPVLLKIQFKDGKVLKVWTNGEELKNSPGALKSTISILLKTALRAYQDHLRLQHAGPGEDSKDHKKEWDAL